MGILIGASFQLATSADVLTLSGQTVSDFSFGTLAEARLRCKTNGFMAQQISNNPETNIDTATDWVLPRASAPGDYQVRYTGLTGDTFAQGGSSSTVPENTWHALSTLINYTWYHSDNTSTIGGKDSTFTVQIRKGTGAVLASNLYSVRADREDF